jgi:hypothetical protein
MWHPAPSVASAPPGASDPRHRWRRTFSRRGLLRAATAAPALAIGARLLAPPLGIAAARGDEALPIPGGNDFLDDGHFVHVFVPAFGQEPSTVNHLNGFVAAAEIQGTGTGTDTQTGKTTTYHYDADMRFMIGDYIAADGRIRRATFGFV